VVSWPMLIEPDMTRRPPSQRTNASVNCTIMKIPPMKDPLAIAICDSAGPGRVGQGRASRRPQVVSRTSKRLDNHYSIFACDSPSGFIRSCT
jgi:hypothetical protein